MIESVPFVGEVSGYGSGNVCAVHVMRQVNACAAPRFERALRGAEYVACLGRPSRRSGRSSSCNRLKGGPRSFGRLPTGQGAGGGVAAPSDNQRPAGATQLLLW